jgi:hypothetical protein
MDATDYGYEPRTEEPHARASEAARQRQNAQHAALLTSYAQAIVDRLLGPEPEPVICTVCDGECNGGIRTTPHLLPLCRPCLRVLTRKEPWWLRVLKRAMGRRRTN